MEIVLASASPRRSELLREWGMPFRAVPAEGVDEESVTGEARDVAQRLACIKAESVLAALRGRLDAARLLVVGADTVVEIDGDVLGKPEDRDHARRTLARLAGRVHRVHTGVAVVRAGGEALEAVETSEVTFRPLAPADIEAYLDTGDHRGKAGAYGIQSEGRRLVAGFRGCYYNVVGLPVKRLTAMLARAGFPIAPRPCDCERQPLWRGGTGCAPAAAR